MPVPAPPEVRAQAIRLYLDGESCTTVGAKLGVSPTTVNKWVVRTHGHGARDRLPHPQDDGAPEVYKGGWVQRGSVLLPLTPLRNRAACRSGLGESSHKTPTQVGPARAATPHRASPTRKTPTDS